MRFNKILLLAFLSSIYSNYSFSQSNVLGSWREHLPYLKGVSVSVGNGKVYCATSEGLFSYSESDNSIERYSKLNGLSDFGFSTIAYNSSVNLLVIGYSNANIDLLSDDGSVYNLSDISRKNISGNKTINSITMDGKFAYLSCGFGIVVLDLSRKEIKDTYIIGINGASLNIGQVALDGTNIFAAAEDGVYKGLLSDPFLANFNNWTKIRDDQSNAGDFNFAVSYNNILYVNFKKNSGDSILAYNGNWGVALANPLPANTIQSMKIVNDKMVITNSFSTSIYDNSLMRTRYIDGSTYNNPIIRDAEISSNDVIFIADNEQGLMKVNAQNVSEKIIPEGPNSQQASAMQVVNGKLWVAHGPRTRAWTNQYSYSGFSSFTPGSWTTNDGYTGQNSSFFTQSNFYDNMSIAVDPSNSNHLFIGSGGRGLLEFLDEKPFKIFLDTNSTLKGQFGNPGQVKIHGICYDQNKNLWVSNAGVNTVINVYKTDNTWKAFNFPGLVNSNSKTGDMVIDDLDYKWLILFENIGGKDGILVFDDNGTIDDITDDKSSIVEFGGNRVRSIAKDKEGVIWAGTEEGVYIFYPPSIVPQRILIKQDDSFQYLLATESIISIAVDAANQKWIGTEYGGVFVFSPDGQKQIYHFTKENSPLFSNTISCISIDNKTGEVYIGTDKGLISYQGSAVEGGTGCTDLIVYPNPVVRNYNGPIAVRGVVPNGIVKITDVSGGLVYQATSTGAQFIWDGTNLSGEKVQTGVYLVFSTDELGENHCSTKLIFQH